MILTITQLSIVIQNSSVGHVNILPKTVHFAETSKRVATGVKLDILTGLAHVRRSGLRERIRGMPAMAN